MIQKAFYLDSCIWRDYFENRSDRFRPLGDWALSLINKIIKEDNLIIFSDILIEELENQYSSEELNKFLKMIPKELIIRIEANEKQTKEAFRIKNKLNIPFGDALHAILARDNNAILISRDKHFYELSEHVTIRKPEELI